LFPQVTTKKGYDSCRKADYLNAKDEITDKMFANLGETTITHLRNTFEGTQTGACVLQAAPNCATTASFRLLFLRVQITYEQCVLCEFAKHQHHFFLGLLFSSKSDFDWLHEPWH